MAKGLEIERRYLAMGCKLSGLSGPRRRIVQGYFDEPGASKRIRILDDCEAVLTIKRGEGLVREETETPLGLEEARRRLATTDSVISKTRVKQDGWDVDIIDPPFGAPEHGRPLIVAERELATPDEAIVLPDWLGETHEVTTIMCAGLLADFLRLMKRGDLPTSSPFRVSLDTTVWFLAQQIYPRNIGIFAAYLDERLPKNVRIAN